jgi:leucyl-tRNA synthetase
VLVCYKGFFMEKCLYMNASKGKGKVPSYDHLKIEKKWQKAWQEQGTYKTEAPQKGKKAKPKMYVLDMFPYPSGAGLHVGHPRGYIGSDVYARMQRMNGFNVLHPMGFDSFGLPAEQYAIKTGKHPGPFTDSLVKQYKRQLEIIGFSYDWSREVDTHRPEYYKWTQWIFLQLYNAWYDQKKNKARSIDELIAVFEKSGNKPIAAVTDTEEVFSAKEWKSFSHLEKQEVLMHYRLAYEGFAEVNWCEALGTVLANDEIIDGPDGPVSERGGYPVIKRMMRQWFMRITAYADRLAEGLEDIDWPNNIKEIQKNWIGKSQGSEIRFEIVSDREKHDVGDITVFTTRPDTLFGVTYVVFAPEHEDVQALREYISNWSEVEKYLKEVANKNEIERTNADKDKTGIQLKGIHAINPANGEDMPVWIADYVLAGYGTGAVMAVPAHDERDFVFAKKYHLPIKEVILHPSKEHNNTYTGDGVLVNSDDFNGLLSTEAKKAITVFAKGKIVTKYKMRDAIFARQRYWGEPIPLRHEVNGLITPLKEKELPLLLPNVKSYAPSGNGESPLATVKQWIKAGYETNTMPGWAGSSWYFLRYMDPHNAKAFADKKALDYWRDVDMYVGGAEHATGHLLYSRFWHKFLYDMGYVPTKEPFKALRNQGLIGGADGRKMSKSWGNVVNPDGVVKTYGADSLRLFEMFLGPFESHLPWSTDGIIGTRRFIERVWRLAQKAASSAKATAPQVKILHKTIKKVTDDIKNFAFNTAVSQMMICLNEFESATAKGYGETKNSSVSVDDFKIFLQLLAPFAPHVSDELWQHMGGKGSIHLSSWPKYNAKYLIEDEVTIGVQVNGKVRAELTIASDATQQAVESAALALPRIQEYVAGKTIKKVIVIPGKIVSIVIE